MRHRTRTLVSLGTALAVFAGGCAYYNTLYNANLKFDEAQVQKERADPEREQISSTEDRLYTEAFEKAAKVVKYYPDSKWVDDALLLMAKASYEKRDYSTANRKFDEILKFYPDSKYVPEALVLKARSQIATKEYAAALATLEIARGRDDKKYRDDVTYLTGLVHQERGELEDAMTNFAVVVDEHEDSEWFAESGVRAGHIAEEWEQYETAMIFFGRVQDKGHTRRERFRGGFAKGECLLMEGHYDEARATFDEIASKTTEERDIGRALLLKGKAVEESGNVDEAILVYEDIIAEFPRKEAAAEARFAIGQIWDRKKEYDRALEQYDLVKDEGTGHEAYRKAATRMNDLQRVLDLREAIASDGDEDRDRKRYLLAEHLLETFEDTDGALAEYGSLASDAEGTEWGAKALYAQAWVLEHRLDEPDSADVVLFQLANHYNGTEVDAAARRRFGFPVWKVEEIDAPRVHFVRPEGMGAPDDIFLSRVEPENVPLPPGVREVKVWVRAHIDDGGNVESTKVVKSGGPEFDAAAEEAAKASAFLSPSAGGAAITVLEYRFPPASAAPADSLPASLIPEEAGVDAPVDSAAVRLPASTPDLPATPSLRGRNLDVD